MDNAATYNKDAEKNREIDMAELNALLGNWEVWTAENACHVNWYDSIPIRSAILSDVLQSLTIFSDIWKRRFLITDYNIFTTIILV